MTSISPYWFLDPEFDKANIKIVYLPKPGETHLPQATVSFGSFQDNLSAEETVFQDKKWQDVCAKEPLENESIVAIRSIDTETGHLEVVPEQYKTWKTRANEDFYNLHAPDPWHISHMPWLCNVQFIGTTTDDKFFVGDRPPKEDGKLPAFQIPGGKLSPDDTDDIKKEIIKPDIGAFREFMEEVGDVPLTGVPSFLGISLYPSRCIVTMHYMGKVNMTAEELGQWREENKERIEDYNEFPQTHFFPLTPDGFQSAINSQRLRETTEVGILLGARQALGEEWFVQNCPERMVSPELPRKILGLPQIARNSQSSSNRLM